MELEELPYQIEKMVKTDSGLNGLEPPPLPSAGLTLLLHNPLEVLLSVTQDVPSGLYV